jgi:hypothetical protein
MPVPTLTPTLLLQDNLNQLREQVKAKAARIPKTDPATYNKQIGQLQSEFDKQHKKILELGTQFDQIDKLAQSGLIPRENADEAMWRMLVPTEVAKAMFPKTSETGSQAPLSPGTLEGKALNEGIGSFTNAAPIQGNWNPFVVNYRKQEDLIGKYKEWQDYIGYHSRPDVQQRQLDIQWDSAMKGDSTNKWNPKDPEIAALRSKGPIGQAVRDKVYGAPPISPPMATVTPLSQEVQKEVAKQKPEMVQVYKPDGTPIKVPKSEWTAQKSAALSEGWSE